HVTQSRTLDAESVSYIDSEAARQQSGHEVEFHGETRTALQVVSIEKSGLREKRIRALDIPIDQKVLPRDECFIEDQHRIVFIEAARERMIERTPRILLVRGPAQQLRAGRIHRRDEDQREILGLSCLQSRCAV